MVASFEAGSVRPPEAQAAAGVAAYQIGTFWFFRNDKRWEWSDELFGMHGYEPGTVTPSTQLLLQHTHPDERRQVAAGLMRVLRGHAFRSRHRIIDTARHTHTVVVVGDTMFDETGAVIGTSGFYVDVTEALQADISSVVAQIAASRAVIDQAKGVLMAAHGISAERAFDILVWRSQETNIKLRDFAAHFMTSVTRHTISPDCSALIDNALLTLE